MTWQAVPTGRPAWVALFYAARWPRSQRKFPPAGSGGPVPPKRSGFAPHRWDASSPPRSHVALTAARDSVRRLRRVLGGCAAQPVLRTSEHRSAVGRASGQMWASPDADGSGRLAAHTWASFGGDVGESRSSCRRIPAQMWESQSRRRCGRVSPGAAAQRRLQDASRPDVRPEGRRPCVQRERGRPCCRKTSDRDCSGEELTPPTSPPGLAQICTRRD